MSYSDSTSATTLISVEEYLSAAYSPDVDYVDGVLEERNGGEKPHSKAQRKLILLLEDASGGKICVWPEQRVQVLPTRYRVVDVCATIGEPDEDIFTTPPFICIEVLSRRDTMTTIQEKLDDYLSFGVPHIWVLDPRRSKAFSYGTDGLVEVVDAFVTHPLRLFCRSPNWLLDLRDWARTSGACGSVSKTICDDARLVQAVPSCLPRSPRPAGVCFNLG